MTEDTPFNFVSMGEFSIFELQTINYYRFMFYGQQIKWFYQNEGSLISINDKKRIEFLEEKYYYYKHPKSKMNDISTQQVFKDILECIKNKENYNSVLFQPNTIINYMLEIEEGIPHFYMFRSDKLDTNSKALFAIFEKDQITLFNSVFDCRLRKTKLFNRILQFVSDNFDTPRYYYAKGNIFSRTDKDFIIPFKQNGDPFIIKLDNQN